MIVRILGQRVTVKFTKDVDTPMGGTIDPANRHVGRVSVHRGLLCVSPDQSPDQVADTLLHEILHVMLVMIGHDDEDIVFRLAPVLLDFMRRNPRAMAFLLGSKA